MGLQQKIGDRGRGAGQDGIPRDLTLGQDVPHQRVAVGVEAAARQPEHGVANLDAVPVDDLVTLDAADDEAGDVEVTEGVEAGQLGGLAAHQGAAGLPAG